MSLETGVNEGDRNVDSSGMDLRRAIRNSKQQVYDAIRTCLNYLNRGLIELHTKIQASLKGINLMEANTQ